MGFLNIGCGSSRCADGADACGCGADACSARGCCANACCSDGGGDGLSAIARGDVFCCTCACGCVCCSTSRPPGDITGMVWDCNKLWIDGGVVAVVDGVVGVVDGAATSWFEGGSKNCITVSPESSESSVFGLNFFLIISLCVLADCSNLVVRPSIL